MKSINKNKKRIPLEGEIAPKNTTSKQVKAQHGSGDVSQRVMTEDKDSKDKELNYDENGKKIR